MLELNVLERLVCFTKEELDILDGHNHIDWSIFEDNQSNSNVIDYHKLLSKDEMISVRKHTRFIEYPKHRHNYIELSYVYGGEITHYIEGKTIIIKEGEILLLNQNIEHAIKQANENDIVFNFIIRQEFLEFLSSIMEPNNNVTSFVFDALYSYKNIGEYLLFNVCDDTEIRKNIEDIISTIYTKDLNKGLCLKLLVGLLLANLMKHPEKIISYSQHSYEKIISSTILQYIYTDYKMGSLQELSNLLHQPDYKICKIIKKVTGYTFKQLIQEERLKKATFLLKTTDMLITEIMHEVGYQNITYFYKIFKQKYKMTPSDYRVLHNNNGSAK